MRRISFALAASLLMFATPPVEAVQCPADKKTDRVFISFPDCLDAQPKRISVVIDNKTRIAERLGEAREWEVVGKAGEFCILEVKLNSVSLPGYCTAVNLSAKEDSVGLTKVAAIEVPSVPRWQLDVVMDKERKPVPKQAPQVSFTVTRALSFVCDRTPDQENGTTPVYMQLAEPDAVVVESVKEKLKVTVTKKELEANRNNATFGALYKPEVTETGPSRPNKTQYEFKRKQASGVPIRFIVPDGNGAKESKP